MDCPACKTPIPEEFGRGASRLKQLQNHFWWSHSIEVIRSHELARLADEGKLTESEIAELKQLPLPIGSR